MQAKLKRAVRIFPDTQTRLAYHDAMNGNPISLKREKRMLAAMGLAKPPRRYYRPCLPVDLGETIKQYGIDVESVLREYLEEQVMSDTCTADELEFGPDAWVYCKDHVKPHQTGWCDIGVSHKISLGTFEGNHTEQARQAYAKARAFGLPIYGE